MPTLAGALRPLASHATSSASASCCYRTLRRLAGRAAATTTPNRGGRFPAVAALMTVANHRAARRDAAPSAPPSASSSCGWRRGHHRARTTHVTHVSSPSDPLPDDVPSWTEAADSPAPSSRFAVRPASRIFCNRSLNMRRHRRRRIRHGLHPRHVPPGDVRGFGVHADVPETRGRVRVPPEVLELEYDHTYMVRGLVVDKKRETC